MSVTNNLLRSNRRGPSSGGNSTTGGAMSPEKAQELFIGLGAIFGCVLLFVLFAFCIRNLARRTAKELPPAPLAYAV